MKKYSRGHIKHLLKKSNNPKQKKTINRNIVRDYRVTYDNPRLYDSWEKHFYTMSAPAIFNLKFENAIKVISFINDLKYKGSKGMNVNLDMSKVTDFGEGAISMLHSVINEIQAKGVRVKGTKPNDKEANSKLEQSGFFKYLVTTISKENRKTKNTILKTGDKHTPNTEIANEVRKSMETIWGVNARCQELYGGIMEMVRNSCDHAFDKTHPTWHLGLSHFDSENKVKFVFVDNGRGIISTFKKTALKNFIHLFKNHADLIDTAFRDGIESRTGLSWRGKGLPTIFEMFTDKLISRLIVITNDVYIDFNSDIYVNLPIKYKGTYYYWEIDTTCKKAYFI